MFKHKNLMMMKMKICCAAVLALGLAACGSETGQHRHRAAPGLIPLRSDKLSDRRRP